MQKQQQELRMDQDKPQFPDRSKGVYHFCKLLPKKVAKLPQREHLFVSFLFLSIVTQ